MGGPPPVWGWTVAHGETLDLAMDVPVGVDPVSAHAQLLLTFRVARDAQEAVAHYDSADPLGALTIESYDAAAQLARISVRSSATYVTSIAPGNYIGDLIMVRPRGGPFGPQRTRLGVVNLQVEGGLTE